jgi:hypothetical protein
MVLSRRPDPVDDLLVDLGLELADGLWTDPARRFGIARSPAGMFIGWLDVGWVAADDPFSEMRDVAHLVERVPRDRLARDIGFALEEAAAARTEHLRDCVRCGERFVPGQMHGADCCHSCAVRDGDVGDGRA